MRSFLLASFALLTMVVVGCDPAETPKPPADAPKTEPGPKVDPAPAPKTEEGKMAPKAEEGKMAPAPAEAPKGETPK